jgi:sterol desaturase/sphingolipid hydroxylase (fatty acid hydroxylase superfamily)
MAEFQMWSVLVVVGFGVLFVLLERIRPYTLGQRFFRDGFFNDFVGYNLIQSFVLALVIASIIDWIDRHTAMYRFRWVADWPFTAQFIFFFIVHDLYIYWFHRLQHHSTLLWRLHEAHHSTRDVDWLSGSRSHALEILINQIVEFAPIVLLGGSPAIVVLKGVVDAVWGMYIHSNIDVRSGRLQWLINGPEMHRWHHADGDAKAHNRNFSTKLAVWDWMFGTAYLPGNRKPSRFGLGQSDFPKGYFSQQWYAFRFTKGNGSVEPNQSQPTRGVHSALDISHSGRSS